MRLILCCAAAMLQGCAALTALLPTFTGCVPKDAPTMPAVALDSALASMSDYEFVLVIAAERNDLLAYSRQADAIIQACK